MGYDRTPSRARRPFTILNFHRSSIQSINDLYARLLENGSTRYLQWLDGNGPGPIDNDLNVMLQFVNEFANQPEFANQTPDVREAFADSLLQSIYNQEGYTSYGQGLKNFLPGGAIESP